MGAYLDATLALAARHALGPAEPERCALERHPRDPLEAPRRVGLAFAFVVADDIAAIRVSMTTRGAGASARGFVDVSAALTRLLAH
jgi:hypothetical protein